MTFRARQNSTLTAFLFLTGGWPSSVKAAPTAPLELEVLGKLEIQAELEPERNGSFKLRGTLLDEAGRPVSGTLTVEGPQAQSFLARSCLAGPVSTRPSESVGIISIPSSGVICAILEGEVKAVSLLVQAPHFLKATKTITSIGLHRLPPPRFVSVPQTIDVGSDDPVTVEVLATSKEAPLPPDTRISLRLVCPDSSPFLVGESSATGSRLARFEFLLNEDHSRGACELEARSAAPKHQSSSSRRQVLVRGVVTLKLVEQSLRGGSSRLIIAASSSGTTIEDGVVELRIAGAFLVGAPVKDGLAHVDVEGDDREQEISISYLPGNPSLVAGPAISAVIPAGRAEPSWGGFHILALSGFALWLGYAWLRPQRENRLPAEVSPPQEAIVESSKKGAGAITGRVLDSHTGSPVPNAQLRLSCPGPERSTDVEKILSDSKGNFHFSTSLSDFPVLRLHADSNSYMSHSSILTGSSVTVHLPERRRALVQNLVNWARARGRPWHVGPPPTPGEIESVARIEKLPETESWAADVASAAYSRFDITEERVLALKSPAVLEDPPPVSEDKNTQSS